MIIVIAVAVIGAILMAISIGASSVPPAFAPVNSISSAGLRLSLVAGIFAMIGAIVQGGNVSDTISSGLLTGEIAIAQAASILVIGSLIVIISVVTNYPMPTAFTLVGAVLGSSFAFEGKIIWFSTGITVSFWILTPFVAIVLSYILARVLRRFISIENSVNKVNKILFLAGCYVAYTAGAASVGLAVGPLKSLELPLIYLLITGGVAIMLGTWLFSPRIINVISYDYSNVGPRRSAAALLASGLIAQVGIQLGVPVSFGLAIIPAVIGSGLVEGTENKDIRKIVFTVFRWVSAFFIAAFLSFLFGKFWFLIGYV